LTETNFFLASSVFGMQTSNQRSISPDARFTLERRAYLSHDFLPFVFRPHSTPHLPEQQRIVAWWSNGNAVSYHIVKSLIMRGLTEGAKPWSWTAED